MLVSYEPLHHKYRPQTFAHLVGQSSITTTLTNAIALRRIAPAYLFTGPRGTGKTSSARILAKSLNCKQQDQPTASPCGVCEVCKSIASGNALDVIEIDAASNTGVDNIRDIIEKAQFAPVQCRYKVYIIDEVHMLSTAAFNALLKTLEEPPKHVVFVLATTDPQRVLPTIISRCQRFDFRRIPLEEMVNHLTGIAANENINITPDALTLVAQVAQGGLRDAESLLDQLSLLPGQVTAEAVWDLVGAVPERDLLALTNAIASDDAQTVLEQCRQLMDKGREPLVVLQNLAGFYRDLLIAKTAPNRSDLVAVTPPTWKQLREFAQQQDASQILFWSQQLKNSEAQVKNTTQPRLWLEVTLLGLLPGASSFQLGLQTRKPESNGTIKSSQSRHSSISERNLPSNQFQNETPLPLHTEEQSRQQPSTPVVDTTDRSLHPRQTLPDQTAKAASPAPVHQEQPESELNSTVSQSTENLTESAVPQSAGHEQVWQNVLTHVQPPFTQGLLRQHGRLLAFDGSVAHIDISSQPLLKLAQSKLANIVAAFEAVYKSKVTVSLKAGSSESSSIAPAKEPATRSTVTKAISQAAVTQPTANYSPTSTVRDVQLGVKEILSSSGQDNNVPVHDANPRFNQATSDEIAVTMLGERREKNRDRDTPPISLTQSPMPQSPSNIELDADEIEKALGNIKQFFEGEIVELTDDFGLSEPVAPLAPQFDTEDTKSDAALKPPEPELEEGDLDSLIEPVVPHSRHEGEIATNNNTHQSALSDGSEDEDDIPF